MTGKERQELRLEQLKSLYDWHFGNKGRSAQIDRSELTDEENLAYQYLSEKGLIKLSRMGQKFYQLEITPFGIDYVESRENAN